MGIDNVSLLDLAEKALEEEEKEKKVILLKKAILAQRELSKKVNSFYPDAVVFSSSGEKIEQFTKPHWEAKQKAMCSWAQLNEALLNFNYDLLQKLVGKND